MRLATLDDTRGGSPAVQLSSGEFLNLRRAARPDTLERWIPDTVLDILAAGDAALAVLRDLVAHIEGLGVKERTVLRDTGAIRASDALLLAPIPRPGMILAAGLAYRSHLAEMSGTPVPQRPTAFMKSPGSVCAPGAGITLPGQAADHVDYEGELALVFGRTCHNVAPEDAMACIAGFTVANDLSARDWVEAVWAATQPWEARQTWEVNIMGKQMPDFTPLGPVITTRDEIPDPGLMRLQTRLNDRIMQDALVSDMIFSLPEVVSYFSRWYRFMPGDILLTGTPAGVGAGRKPPVFLRPGDRVEVEITGIGVLASTFHGHAQTPAM